MPKGSYVENLGCKALTAFHNSEGKQVAKSQQLVACGTRALLDHSPGNKGRVDTSPEIFENATISRHFGWLPVISPPGSFATKRSHLATKETEFYFV